MDFRQLVKTHRETRADVTIAVLPVAECAVSQLGILAVNQAGRVQSFIEKPTRPEQLEGYRTPATWLEGRGVPAAGREYLASMGIYLFRREVLIDLLEAQPPAKDFGKEIFPRSLKTHQVQAHLFDGYWEDLGTVKSYHEASLALASDQPPFDFHRPEGVIYTRMRYLPAARVCDATLKHSLISDGSLVEPGTTIERSMLGVRSRIGHHCTIRDTIIIGADRFETETERAQNRKEGVPNFIVGDNTVIERAIVDKDSRIGSNVKIVNQRGVQEEETDMYVIREGIVVIPKATVVPDGTVI
jgi:glucose-1-phosphate adenylyltransferase